MANIEIGRAGWDVQMAYPNSVSWRSGNSGRQLVISGHLKDTATLEEAFVLKDQLTRQVRNELEPGIIAVFVDPASKTEFGHTLSGYYVLESANVLGTHALGSLQDTGFFTYTATMTHLDTNLFETVVVSEVLTNNHSKTSANTDNMVGIGPASTTNPIGGGVGHTREVAGRSTNNTDIVLSRGFTPPLTAVWSVHPFYFYQGASTIKYRDYIITGRPTISDQDGFGQYISAGEWEINNGLIRLKGVAQPNGDQFTIEQWDPSAKAWESQQQFVLRHSGADFSNIRWEHLIVLRNDPEEVAIRLITPPSSSGESRRASLDLSLQRGMQFARGYFTIRGQSIGTMGIRRSSTDAATSFTYGVHDASNDAGGNRWVLGSRETVTKDTTNGGIQKTGISGEANQYLDFFIGMELNGSSASTIDVAEELGDQYVYHISQKVYPILPGGVNL